MKDKVKLRLAVVLILSTGILPFIFFAIGWIGWGVKAGSVAALSAFAGLSLAGWILLVTVEDLSWIAALFPFASAIVYTVLPDFFVGPFDDAAVLAAGAVMTFTLWARKQPETPKWVIFPLFVSALYVLIGGFIPGPVDELLVTAMAAGTSAYGASRKRLSPTTEQQALPGNDLAGDEG